MLKGTKSVLLIFKEISNFIFDILGGLCQILILFNDVKSTGSGILVGNSRKSTKAGPNCFDQYLQTGSFIDH